MLWNEIDYESQIEVLDKLYDIAVLEQDLKLKINLISAINELKMWLNESEISNEDISDEEYVVAAQEGYIESKTSSLFSMIFGKK